MRVLVSILMSSCLALACSQPTPAADGTSPRRVIIAFTEARPLADASVLADLSRACGLRVEYGHAISPRSAAYRLHCSTADPQCSDALARLTRHAGVAYAEFDQRVDLPSDRQEKLP